VANRFLEAGGILRPQALRIIAEESKAGPLGAGAAANTPATQAAAIRAARPESAARLAASGEVPQRYARFMGTKRTRQGDLNIQAAGQRGFDSTLKRVAQNPENPANVRRAARTADELGLTQAFRATDDALGGAIAGVVGSAPFAAIAPDDQTAGGILAAGASLGAAGSMVSGFTSFRGDAVDADIARFMADTDALGGDTKALFQMPHKQLAAMSSLQGTASNKGVDVVALRTEDYNRMVPEAIGSQGYFSAPTAKDGSKAGRQRIFVDLGHSSLEEGTARITQAPDGMYELTVTRKDGSVAYPLPAADGSQPVIRRKSANDFTVKDGDLISPYFPLNRQPPRIVTASHEFMHALMKSDMFGGDHQPALRGLIYEQYKPDTIQSMAREYAQRLVDAQINNGRVPKPANDEAKAKMIDDMVTELDDASVASTGDRRAWIADEIVAETWQDIAQGIDVNRIRQGKSADGRVVDAARSAMIATTRALETFGMKFDWATGKPLTNPSTVFRDNPLATTPLLRKRILESVRNYDRYLTLLEDAGAVESKGAPLPRSGRAEDWLAEGTMRTHRKADGTMENDVMTVDPDGQVRWKEQSQIDNEYKGRSTAVSDLLKRLGTKMVDDNDPTFGLRRAGVGRTIYSGAELPMSDSPLGYPPVLAAFPEYYRTMYKDAVDSGRAGELVRFSNNTVGTRSDSGGPYRLSQLISSGYAKQSEGLFYGMQITKSGGHMNMQFVDMNAFKASALRAINDGKISFFNNDYKEVVRNLKQLMDNYRNQRDGSYMIGDEGKNILNGLLYGKSRENKGWGAKLNARGSIRTYRMDRMNWIERTGDDGYFFDNDRAKNNRMPETEPVDGQAMPDFLQSDGSTLRVPDESWKADSRRQLQKADEYFRSLAKQRGEEYTNYSDYADRHPEDAAAFFKSYRERAPYASLEGAEVLPAGDAPVAGNGNPNAAPRGTSGGTQGGVTPRGQAMPDESDYRGQHTAPDVESGAPLHDVTGNGIYPADVYSAQGARLYGTGYDAMDRAAFNMINALKGKPNARVTVYRAVPSEASPSELIARYEGHKRQILKTGKIPKDAKGQWENSSRYYDWVSGEIERLKAAPEPPKQVLQIQKGDWITPIRKYAVDHGRSALQGEYKIVSKSVRAKDVFTAGDSWLEWGYDPRD
jgi:hypothetical protein